MTDEGTARLEPVEKGADADLARGAFREGGAYVRSRPPLPAASSDTAFAGHPGCAPRTRRRADDRAPPLSPGARPMKLKPPDQRSA